MTFENAAAAANDIIRGALLQTRQNATYQRDLLLGRQRWSGSDLTGKARQWASYHRSRKAALLRVGNVADSYGARVYLGPDNASRCAVHRLHIVVGGHDIVI